MNQIISFTSIVIFCFCAEQRSVNALNTNDLTTNPFERFYNKKFTVQSKNTGAKNFTCVPGRDGEECSYHGVCKTDGESCVCDDGYTSTSSNNNVQCDYKQKNTLTAFLLELFLGFVGGGYFYLELTSLAVGQLCLFLGGTLLLCCIICVGVVMNGDEKCFHVFAGCYMCVWIIALSGWWIASIVMIAQATLLDGNGMSFPAL
jgi:hypothetical protein